ncbi:hypothetical protein HYDPIDRAFT_145979 [Hydnomerulius pinastri MD-312]|nr:hypothetical protein HYDPIDRAFT_145979 [Hydnomerulius pinastri MD-312]
MEGNILHVLPAELIIRILTFLEFHDLLSCRQVCRLLRTAFEQTAVLQYTIELAVAGVEDGPPSSMEPASRLATLRNSQAAWNSLRWTGVKDVPMLRGSLYELYGGVLVQSTHLGGLVFRRLPSQFRGIEEYTWSLDLPDLDLRDFSLDPAQDLLVLISRPLLRSHATDARLETTIHLRSLTTGKGHPLANQPPIFLHDVDVRAANLTFMVQVHGNHIGVHFVSHGSAPSELVVWNWKTGKVLLNTYGSNLMAFSFLTERLLLVGGFAEVQYLSQPRLFILDLDSTNSGRLEFDDVDYHCAFLYPPCNLWVHPLSFLIRADPSTSWSPDPSYQVPYSIGPGPRLYIITIWVMRGEVISAIDLFVLSSTLLSHIDSLDDNRTGYDFEWEEWGPNGTRMMAQAPHSHVWVCYVFGTKFSSIITNPRDTRNRNSRTLEIWDFNQLGIQRDMSKVEKDAPEVQWHVDDTSILSSSVFAGEVRTNLPYRVIRRTLPAPLEGEPVFTEAMCSEDSLILVDSQSRQFRILTF